MCQGRPGSTIITTIATQSYKHTRLVHCKRSDEVERAYLCLSSYAKFRSEYIGILGRQQQLDLSASFYMLNSLRLSKVHKYKETFGRILRATGFILVCCVILTADIDTCSWLLSSLFKQYKAACHCSHNKMCMHRVM